jgi:hypothetical protein
MTEKFHKDGKRKRPFSDFGDSRLSALLKSVKWRREGGNPPDKDQIIKLIADLNITDNSKEAWRMWKEDCEPLMRKVQ